MIRGYERQDARAARVLLWFGGLTAVIMIVLAAARGAFDSFSAKYGRPAVTLAPTSFPTTDESVPRLQVDPSADLARFRSKEDQMLSSYGWHDRAAGEARIPIDRAMTILLERGLPESRRRP